MKIRTEEYEKRPIDLDWWAKFMDIMKCSPRSRDEQGHYKTISVEVSTDFYDLLLKHKGNFPEGWFKSNAEYFRMILRTGIHSLDEWIKWETQTGAFTFPEHDDLEQLMSIHKKLNVIDSKIRMLELGRSVGAYSRMVDREKVVEINKLLDDCVPKKIRENETFKKGEKAGRAGKRIKK